MKKNEITVKKSLEVEAVAAVLEDLAASMRAGKVCLESECQFVSMVPAEVVDMELAVSQKKNKNKVSLELSWRDIVAQDQLGSTFTISSQEPEIPAEEEPEAAEEEKSEEDEE